MNFQHQGAIIGDKLETSDVVYRMIENFAANDGFAGSWGVEGGRDQRPDALGAWEFAVAGDGEGEGDVSRDDPAVYSWDRGGTLGALGGSDGCGDERDSGQRFQRGIFGINALWCRGSICEDMGCRALAYRGRESGRESLLEEVGIGVPGPAGGPDWVGGLVFCAGVRGLV